MKHSLHLPWARLAWPALFLALFLQTGCKGPAPGVNPKIGPINRDTTSAYLAQATADIEAGRLVAAAQALIAVRRSRGLVPEELYQADFMLNEVAEQLFSEVNSQEGGSRVMRQVYKLGLPLRLRATAGLRTAELLFEEEHPVLAYQMVADVERELPNHPMRDMAADILFRTGTYMLEKGGTYNLFFSYRVKGTAALEFLVEHYAASKHCPRAYALLADRYESLEDYDLALERWEGLLIYHSEDPLVAEASARMPYLRMKRMRRSDYDRSELLRAKQEIERWLSYYPDLEQAEWMRSNLAHCHKTLAEHDLSVARFYVKVDSPTGARLHADRALLEAELSGSEETIASVQKLLAKLPAPDPEAFGVEASDTPGQPAPKSDEALSE